ncbi:MAG TPA: Gfo/Idh/MocA family oxidoreductase [Acetobacteraceae bacterium]|nr:Gfo/Idh/MocA family oxidoreductase [Acetobacteraceae bacterium]
MPPNAVAWAYSCTKATPDAVHKPTTLQLVAAGKSVLCEKPLAVDAADTFVMTEASEAAGVIAMVNLSTGTSMPSNRHGRWLTRRNRHRAPHRGELSAELADGEPLGRLDGP